MSETFYDILEISPDAPPEAVKEAYRRRATELHPDKTAGLPEGERDRAEERMREVNVAYEVLASANRRSLYDECLAEGVDFDQAEAELRPETAAEKAARELAEAEFEADVQRCLGALDQELAKLDPKVKWHRVEEHDEYWVRVLEARKAPNEYTLYVKFLPDLTPEDLPGIVRHGEGMLTFPSEGLVRKNHVYLMLGWVVWGAGKIYRELQAFNRKSWAVRTGRQPRALIGCAGMQEGTAFLPGVDNPYPELNRMRIGLAALGGGKTSSGALVSIQPHPETIPPLPVGKTLPDRNVLVVDDDPLAIQIVRDTLSDHSFTVYHADGWEAFKQIAEKTPMAVVLLDVNLPDMPGEKLAIYARKFLKPAPKVIFHSAKPPAELRRISRIYGAANFLNKGCEEGELVAAVEAAAQAWRDDLASSV